MMQLAPLLDARHAIAARPDRPAIAIVHDSPDVRLVVFRIAPGQQVAPHRSTSTVMLSVIEGSGHVLHSDGETAVTEGSVTIFDPNELHGMRAEATQLVILATIAPRPASRN